MTERDWNHDVYSAAWSEAGWAMALAVVDELRTEAKRQIDAGKAAVRAGERVAEQADSFAEDLAELNRLRMEVAGMLNGDGPTADRVIQLVANHMLSRVEMHPEREQEARRFYGLTE